jgi:outer membrane lipopolysaccharide assembly protein LptE/RlpB
MSGHWVDRVKHRSPNPSPALQLSSSPARLLRGAIAVLALATTLISCGYHLQGTGGALPSTVKVVAVPPFARDVPVLQLDQRVTEAVTRELAQRAKVKVQSTRDGADAILTGTITAYSAVPLSYDNSGRANRYQVTMTAKIQLTDRAGKVIFESPGYRFSEVYERNSNPATYISQEVVAFTSVANDFARALVSNIMEAGPSGH